MVDTYCQLGNRRIDFENTISVTTLEIKKPPKYFASRYMTVIYANSNKEMSGFGKNLILITCGLGNNAFGTLGDGTQIPKYYESPIGSNFIKTHSYYQNILYDCSHHSLVYVGETNTLYAFGNNYRKQVNAYGNQRLVPDQIVAIPHSIRAVFTGKDHSMVVTDNDLIYTWGGNGNAITCKLVTL